jgi:hypothetical protein
MKRYCVSQLDSNVIYVFSSMDEACILVRHLNAETKPRWWSVQPKHQDASAASGHSVISFPQAMRA